MDLSVDHASDDDLLLTEIVADRSMCFQRICCLTHMGTTSNNSGCFRRWNPERIAAAIETTIIQLTSPASWKRLCL